MKSQEKAPETISVKYRPLPGDPKKAEVFGQTFVAGESVDLHGKYAAKVRGNPAFEVSGEKSHGDDFADKRAVEVEEQEDASFEDNVERETKKEYGTTDLDQVERIRRANESNQSRLRTAAEVAAAAGEELPEEEETTKPKPGKGKRGKA